MKAKVIHVVQLGLWVSHGAKCLAVDDCDAYVILEGFE